MRARNLKPSLFSNEVLGQADPLLTILFEGLWCIADREGLLEDRPMRIKAAIFPYRDGLDINRYLTDLERLGFILRYQSGEQKLISVIKFLVHQNPHHTEKLSVLPKPEIVNGCSIPVNPPLWNGENPADSFLPPSDSLQLKGASATPPLVPVVAKPGRREKKKQKLGTFPDEVVAMVSRLMDIWPTERGGQTFRSDDVAACGNVVLILQEFADVTVEKLESAAMGYLEFKPPFPNALEFWFGKSKTAPWRAEVMNMNREARII